MLRKGAFIMRVRKVDSDVIKLYELSQVKFKTTGTIWEVQFSAGVNKSCAIQNISKDTYLDKTTGEIKKRKHNTNRFQSPKSVRKSINRLMDLIRCNATYPAYCKWITLTYAETMTDWCKWYYKNVHLYILILTFKIGKEYVLFENIGWSAIL